MHVSLQFFQLIRSVFFRDNDPLLRIDEKLPHKDDLFAKLSRDLWTHVLQYLMLEDILTFKQLSPFCYTVIHPPIYTLQCPSFHYPFGIKQMDDGEKAPLYRTIRKMQFAYITLTVATKTGEYCPYPLARLALDHLDDIEKFTSENVDKNRSKFKPVLEKSFSKKLCALTRGQQELGEGYITFIDRKRSKFFWIERWCRSLPYYEKKYITHIDLGPTSIFDGLLWKALVSVTGKSEIDSLVICSLNITGFHEKLPNIKTLVIKESFSQTDAGTVSRFLIRHRNTVEDLTLEKVAFREDILDSNICFPNCRRLEFNSIGCVATEAEKTLNWLIQATSNQLEELIIHVDEEQFDLIKGRRLPLKNFPRLLKKVTFHFPGSRSQAELFCKNFLSRISTKKIKTTIFSEGKINIFFE
jgi:hypothetical protein